MKQKVLVIAGPTAVGKTALSVSLAKELNAEIVSADSMQIYTGLDIGTAKPTVKERSGITHHMIDVCHPSERFSVAQYVKEANAVIDSVFLKNKAVIIVGGTGLYIDNLIYNNNFSELDVDMKIRADLQKEAEEIGGEALLEKLSTIDPLYASKLHPNDTKRIVHALEIFYSTGKTQSEHISESRKAEPKYDYLYAVLDCSSRNVLYERINKRVDVMLDSGLVDEAKKVIYSDWYQNSTASQAIGYKEFEPYFRGEVSLEKCVELLKQRSRNYAKRQLTWFRHKDEARFYYIDKSKSVFDEIIKDFSRRIND